jgi:tetratricopeptide (TPR) repeat protein/cold shock CspA family protein
MENTKISAEELEKKKDWKGALDIYQRLYDADENGDLEVLKKIGWCQSKAGLYSEAAATFKDIIACEPKVAKWYYMTGAQYFALEKWETALESLRKAVRLMPDYAAAMHKYGSTLLQLAGNDCELKNHYYIEAEAQFEACRALWGRMPQDQKKRNQIIFADVFLQRGKMYLRRKEYAQAVECLKLSIQLNPDAWESRFQLAKAYSESGDQEAALKALPDVQRPAMQELMVLILLRKGDTEKGLRLLKGSVRSRNRDYLLREIADIYFQKNDLAAACLYAERAVRAEGNSHKNHYCLAWIYKAAGLLKHAKQEAETAIVLKRANHKQDYDEARTFLSLVEKEIAVRHHKQDNAAVLQALQKGMPLPVMPAAAPAARAVTAPNPPKYGRANFKAARAAGRSRTGIIQSFLNGKGCGFLVCSQNGKSFYFHMKDFPEAQHLPVQTGMEVAFELKKTPRGLAAVKLVLVK